MKKMHIHVGESSYVLEKSFKFSGGEIQIKLPDILPDFNFGQPIIIDTLLSSSDDIIELLLVINALDYKYPKCPFELFIAYLPYARQDRACVSGEAFSLEVMCNIINSMGFSKVYIIDAHSQIALDMLYNVAEYRQCDLMSFMISVFDIDVEHVEFVSPDAGATLKTQELCDIYDKQPIQAHKVRDPNTGAICNTTVDIDDFGGCDVIIVDDICDNGGTFVALAKLLKEKNCGKITLMVSHAILPNGADHLFEYIDDIYTTNSIYKGDDERISVLTVSY